MEATGHHTEARNLLHPGLESNRARAGQSAARPNRAEPERLGWTTEQAELSMYATEPNRAEGLNLLSLLSLLGLAQSCSVLLGVLV